MSLFREIFRRKGRSILTISGIAIGVFALVVLGSAAENSNVYVGKLVGYYEDMVTVVEQNDANWVGMANGNRPMSMRTVEEVREHEGVRSVTPQVNMLLDSEYISAIPPMVLSVTDGDEYAAIDLEGGRAITGVDRGVTTLGTDLAKQMKVKVGDTIDIRNRKFEVVGVLERSYVNLIDAAAYLSLSDAQQLYFESLPKAFKDSVVAEDLVVQMGVRAQEGADPDELAGQLERDIEGIRATGPQEMMKVVNTIVGLFTAIVGSIGVLALLVGGMSIVNTMTITVSERTREIGIKRALGASRWRIARDVLSEAALMAGIGGAIGIFFGSLVVTGLNSAMVAATGTSALLMTARLGIGAMLFAIIIGAIGGLYPARFASRLDPAAALAYE